MKYYIIPIVALFLNCAQGLPPDNTDNMTAPVIEVIQEFPTPSPSPSPIPACTCEPHHRDEPAGWRPR